ncbi:xanthine dehydrogenase family protein molybdopterin-binding subunit [Sphingomonas immobilis]|uniref:Xanthine dehydrogenase family protein molybdopterin-binding subunit n=1 Tax=Sphingomonas immobilis TaxID=3063997 RepID=A0ABT8ZZL7_9SPHN|nr:xanthine dehydrogenase family protein molybdopterin-binding subunit [Sphingomonas sp. CA1-15]MDO7842196.1 xanthine dehydrogenase family protein molybdopterin-binding subunit [Sphingomonas sp. CA1-15]
MNAPADVPLAAARFTGERVPRKEDRRLLTGHGAYVDDVTMAGMVHGMFVRSPIARGRIVAIDVEAARALPGVRAVYTAADLDRHPAKLTGLYGSAESKFPDIWPLAKEDVRHVGDPVAIVLADDRYVAEDGAALVVVEYDDADAVVTIDDAATGAIVHPDLDTNVALMIATPEDPGLEAVFAGAAHVVTGTITHQRQAHVPMETRGIVAALQGSGEMLIHASCQSPHMVARYMDLAFAMPDLHFRVIAKDVGGAFGLKVQPWREEVAIVAAALLIGRPVKWIEDRLENLTASNQAREQDVTVRLAFDADATLLAADIDYRCNLGAYPHGADPNSLAMVMFPGPYKLPRYKFRAQGFYSNTAGQAAYRGPWAMESLARETLLEKAARQIGIDAVELRRRNLITAADQPHTMLTGFVIDRVTPRETLDKLVAHLDTPAFRAEQAAARAAGRYLGLGFAVYVEPTTMAFGGILSSDVADIRIEPTGKVTLTVSTHSQGHGTETTMAQLVADTLGVDIEDVSVMEDDSSRGGFGPGAGGSRQAVSGGGATLIASGKLADKIRAIAAHVLNASPDTISLAGGKVLVAGVAEMTTTVKEIAEIAYYQTERLPEGMEAGLEARHRYRPPPVVYSNAAHACTVEVDVETGMVKILRWVTCEDCGPMINPAVVEGQIAGGVVQGIGGVLYEQISYDARGNPTAVTFKDYLIPTAHDVPELEFLHIATPSASEGGFKGVGEGGAIVGPPTLVNAIADALAPFGADCLTLPLSPPRVLAEIGTRD